MNERPQTITVTMTLMEWRVTLDALSCANTWADGKDKDTYARNWAVKHIIPKFAYACNPQDKKYKNVPLSTLVQLNAIHEHDYRTNEYFLNDILTDYEIEEKANDYKKTN